MTIAAARKKARADSRVYRQGSGWILALWTEQTAAWNESIELTCREAHEQRSAWIARRVAELTAVA